MAAYCQVYGMIHFTSPASWLPVHRDQLRAQRLVMSIGKLYLLPLFTARTLEQQSNQKQIEPTYGHYTGSPQQRN